MSHVRFVEQPELRRPVLILSFAGWNDASEVATTAVRFLVSRWEAKKFADIDAEDFYNFARVRRTSESKRTSIEPSPGQKTPFTIT